MTATKTVTWIRLCDDCLYPGDTQFYYGTVNQERLCARCQSKEAIHVVNPKVNDPRLTGGGHPEFQTCVELVPYRPYICDANGYYGELGVSVYATRREIREAYQSLNGQDSVRLTYIVSQLLDDEIRARYDATPLGNIFRDDEVEGWIRSAKARLVREYIQAGEEIPDDLLREGEVPDEMVVDRAFRKDENVLTGPRRDRWPYSYYVWQSPIEEDGRLRQWQAELARAMCQRGDHRLISVGLQGAIDESVVVLPVGYRLVVFLHYLQWPTDELVEEALSLITR